MATLEKLKEHIKKSGEKLAEVKNNAGENKYDSEVRKIRKHYKRLTRKVGKIEYMEKKKQEKAQKKKSEDKS